MVVKGSGVNGHEHSGTADAERQALGTAATMAGEVIGRAVSGMTEKKKQKRTGTDLEADYAENNPLYKALYESYTERGVDEGVAHKAAVTRVKGEDTDTNSDIAAADLTASQWTPSVEKGSSNNVAQVEADLVVEEDSLAVNASEKPTVKEATIVDHGTKFFFDPRNFEEDKVSAPIEQSTQQSNHEAKTSTYTPDAVQKLSWIDLQKTAKAIRLRTNLQSQSGKRRDLEAFVIQHGDKLNQDEAKPAAESEEKAEAKTSLSEETDSNKPQAAQKEEGASLTENISDGYKARAVPPDQAEAASKDFAQGKDANNSPAISQANEQVRNPVVREPLHQMFYEALTKSGVDSELADKAGKDMAEGKGAKSSEYVKQAQNSALDKDIDKSRMSKPEKDWLKASRYNTTKDPRKRDREIAVKGHRNGMNKREVINMLKLSPVAAAEGKKDATKGMQYIYTVQKKAERTVQQTQSAKQNKLMKQSRRKGITV